MTDLHKPKISRRGKLAASTSLRGFASIDEAKDAPHEYLCPITLQLMRDPVLLVETGQVYDRESIESWFKSGHSSCPTSRTINGVVPTLLDSLACLLESLPSRGRMF